MSVRYYRLDQRDRAARARELAECRAQLIGCRETGAASTTLMSRRLDSCGRSLSRIKGAALEAELAASRQLRDALTERDRRWATWEVVALSVGVALGAGLAGGLIGWLSK